MTFKRRSLVGRNLHGSPFNSPARQRVAQSVHRRAIAQTVRQFSGVTFGAASKANLKVVVRVRPLNSKEEEKNASSVLQIVDEHMLVFDPKQEEDVFFFHGVRQHRDITRKQHKDQKFVFEKIFGPDSTNEDIFKDTTKEIVETLLQGYNCSVFAYGATGAGKTFTMVGKPECPGITLLTLMELYELIKRTEEQEPGTSIEVAVSYLEVYNETVRDLLQPGGPLQVQEVGHQILVPGLSFHKPTGSEHLMSLLAFGNQNRTQHPTDANAESSRSHAVFQVLVKQQRATDCSEASQSSVSVAKLSMIDLAGSERGGVTGGKGIRFREGANINRSLLALGNCINALADGKSHIPYRDSKLTRLLKDSLGGNCRSVMVAAVSMASTTFEDTFNTLRYANRAKTIKTTLKKNQMSVETHVSAYVKIVEALKVELQQSEVREKTQAEHYEQRIKELQMQLQEARDVNKRLLDSQQSAQCVVPATAELLDNTCDAKHATTDEELQVVDHESVVPKAFSAQEEDKVLPTVDAALQADFVTAAAKWRDVHRECLEMAGLERSLELRLYITRLKKQRLAIIAFAAYKLEKSVKKLERSEAQLLERLQQTRTIRRAAEKRCEAAKVAYNQLATSNGVVDMLISEAQQQESEQFLVQHKSTLQSLTRELFAELQDCFCTQRTLLTTVRGLHTHLHSSGQHTDHTSSMFQAAVTSLDEYRIAWADQHHQPEGKLETNSDPSPTPPDIDWLTKMDNTMPGDPGTPLEGTATGDLRANCLRKSIMKGSTSTINLQDTHTSPLVIPNPSHSSEQLRQFTLENTAANKFLSCVVRPHIPLVVAQLVDAETSSAKALGEGVPLRSVSEEDTELTVPNARHSLPSIGGLYNRRDTFTVSGSLSSSNLASSGDERSNPDAYTSLAENKVGVAESSTVAQPARKACLLRQSATQNLTSLSSFRFCTQDNSGFPTENDLHLHNEQSLNNSSDLSCSSNIRSNIPGSRCAIYLPSDNSNSLNENISSETGSSSSSKFYSGDNPTVGFLPSSPVCVSSISNSFCPNDESAPSSASKCDSSIHGNLLLATEDKHLNNVFTGLEPHEIVPQRSVTSHLQFHPPSSEHNTPNCLTTPGEEALNSTFSVTSSTRNSSMVPNVLHILEGRPSVVDMPPPSSVKQPFKHLKGILKNNHSTNNVVGHSGTPSGVRKSLGRSQSVKHLSSSTKKMPGSASKFTLGSGGAMRRVMSFKTQRYLRDYGTANQENIAPAAEGGSGRKLFSSSASCSTIAEAVVSQALVRPGKPSASKTSTAISWRP